MFLNLILTLTMADSESETINLTVSKSGTTHSITLPGTALLTDLISASEDALQHSAPTTVYDWDKAKFIAAGSLLRSGPDDTKPIAHLHNKKVTLQVPTVQDIESIKHSSDAAKAREARRAAQRRAAVPAARTTVRRPGEANYGFLRIEPLPGLRNPERSREFLERLADDVGIKAAMRKHGFTGTCVVGWCGGIVIEEILHHPSEARWYVFSKENYPSSLKTSLSGDVFVIALS